uniref:Serine protease 55 n=1 Tax=Ficedula albicollis TaxID=59894 RepID=A0A803VS21_FICAL
MWNAGEVLGHLQGHCCSERAGGSAGPGWIEMLLLTLCCLASLTSSVQAGFVSQHSRHRRDAEYSHVGCGLRPSFESFQETGKRIGTGTDVKPGEFPWLVSIQSQGKHICGGSIISALWILTAAHCFAHELPPDLTVAVGGVDLSLPLEEHSPDSLILHEEFNRTSLQNDIALIQLSNPIEFSKEKTPLCLPFVCDMDSWQHCWAAGWENTSAASRVLQKTQMELISREKCLQQIPHLVGSVMCAETEQGGGGGGCKERPVAAHFKGKLLVLEVHQGWDVPQHQLSTRNDPWEAEELHSPAGVFLWMGKRGCPTRRDGMVCLKWKFGAFQPWILEETSSPEAAPFYLPGLEGNPPQELGEALPLTL